MAVVVATIAAMVLGFIWYGPLFGKKWMEAQGIKEQSKKMPVGPMVGMLVTAFIMAFVLAQVFAWTAIRSMGDALMATFILWIGFILAAMVPQVLFEKHNKTLFYIGVSHHLVGMLLMAAIIFSM